MLFYIVQKSSVIKDACFRRSVDTSTCYIKQLLGYITLHLRFFQISDGCHVAVFEYTKLESSKTLTGVALKSGWCSFGFLSSCVSWVDQKLFEGYRGENIWKWWQCYCAEFLWTASCYCTLLQIMSSTCGNLETRWSSSCTVAGNKYTRINGEFINSAFRHMLGKIRDSLDTYRNFWLKRLTNIEDQQPEYDA